MHTFHVIPKTVMRRLSRDLADEGYSPWNLFLDLAYTLPLIYLAFSGMRLPSLADYWHCLLVNELIQTALLRT